MERYGDFFPENPAEPRRAARAHGPAHGGHAGDAQLDDARAAGAAPGPVRAAARGHGPRAGRWTSSAQNLQQLFPAAGLGPAATTSQGQDPLGFAEAAQMMNELGDLDQLENLLRGATQPGRAGRGRHRPGPRAARRRRGPQPRAAGRAGQDARGRRPHRATRRAGSSSRPRGMRKIGSNALADLFSKLAKDKLGRHEIERTGIGHERTYDTKPYEFGDPFNLHIERTVRNAVARAGGGHAGAAHARRLRDRADRARSCGRPPC